MLKRQRALTPPPSVSELPSGPDFQIGEPTSFNHDAKRQRTAAPELDGRLRGMNYTAYDDDNDEYAGEGNDNDLTDQIAEAEDEEASGWEEQAGQYKDMNRLLHQLHFEQQRRLHFVASSTNAVPNHYQSPRHQLDPSPQAPKHPQRTSGFSSLRPQEEPSSRESHSSSDNADQVWSNYEANNRLLGSIIRQRLQESG